MCRLAWQLLGLLGNVLGLLGMLGNVLGMPWWYTTPLASQLLRKQVGGFIFDVGLLGPCGKHAEEAEDVASMPRTLLRHA